MALFSEEKEKEHFHHHKGCSATLPCQLAAFTFIFLSFFVFLSEKLRSERIKVAGKTINQKTGPIIILTIDDGGSYRDDMWRHIRRNEITLLPCCYVCFFIYLDMATDLVENLQICFQGALGAFVPAILIISLTITWTHAWCWWNCSNQLLLSAANVRSGLCLKVVTLLKFFLWSAVIIKIKNFNKMRRNYCRRL